MSNATTERFFSYSMLRLFQQCERRYYFERVQKLPCPDTSALAVGEVYHSALAELLTGSVLPLSNIARTAVWKFDERLKKLGVDHEGLVTEMVTNLHRVLTLIGPHALTPISMPPGAEKPLAIEIKFLDHRLGFAGVLDLCSQNTPVTTDKGNVTTWKPGEMCVIDWKILSGDRRRTERSARLSAQLGLYALETGIHNVGYVEIPRNWDRPINVQVVHFNWEDLRQWEVHLRGARAAAFSRGTAIENYAQCTRENGLCSPLYCPFWDKCYGKEEPVAVHPAG